MAHFAKVNTDNLVTNVIVAEQNFIDKYDDGEPGRWVKTSYNIRGGIYYDPETMEPVEDQSVIDDDEGRKRKNYAGIGDTYDEEREVFLPPKPFLSWILNETTWDWEAPTPVPDDGKNYEWNEENQKWVEVSLE